MHRVFKKLLTSRDLPTPSRIALEIMRLSSNENTSLNDIADIIAKDPALSGKLLKYANTALFAAAPVISIRKAIVRLGTDIVMGLSLGFSLLSKNRQGRCENFDYNCFWSSSLATAVAARGLAEIRSGFDADELFVCGLLSRIGCLALASIYPQKYSEILEGHPSDDDLLVLESREFGVDQVELTVELFQEWGIPEMYSSALGQLKDHRKPPGTAGLPGLCNLLRLAGMISRICIGEASSPEDVSKAEDLALQSLIPPEDLHALFGRIISSWQEWSILFEIPARECTSISPGVSAAETTETRPAEAGDSFCILAVDDDPQTLHTLKTLLTDNASSILTAQNSDEALQLAVQYQPDLIIANWHMPDISGLELCRILRRTEFAKHLYIIILTASESDDELVQAFDAGADDYVGKPFIPKVLEARVRGGRRIIGYQEKMHKDRAVIQNYADQLTAVNKRFHTMAMTDALTGLPNRRHAMERLEEMISESRRTGEMFSCIMIDVDHFKQINDTYGHDSGDLVLKEIASVFKRKSRASDLISRFGGEEFLVISDLKSLYETFIFAERLRQQVANHVIILQETTMRVTISLGLTIMSPDITEGSSLILSADQALYNAKRNGRNRVEISRHIRQADTG